LSSRNYKKEFVEHLLSLMPPQDLTTLMRSHAMLPLKNLLPRFQVHDEERLPIVEVNVPCSRGHDNIRPSSPLPEPTLPTFEWIGEGVMINKKQFDKKLQNFTQDEKKYRMK